MKKHFFFFCFWCLAVSLAPALAQTEVWKVTIQKKDNTYTLLNANNFNPVGSNQLGETDKQRLEVTCQGLDCRQLAASLKGGTPVGGPAPAAVVLAAPAGFAATAATAEFELSGTTVANMVGQAGTLLFQDNGTPLPDAKVLVKIASRRSEGDASSTTGTNKPVD